MACFNRPYQHTADTHPLHDLLLTYRLATSVLVYPTFWRLRTLLTSRVWQPYQETRVWYNSTGKMVGFAMLWRRRPDSPYLVLEQIIHPYLGKSSLQQEMIIWAIQRSKTLVNEQQQPVSLIAYESLLPLENQLKLYGFTPVPPDPERHNVTFSRLLGGELPPPVLPDGCHIRRLGPADDVETYHALYGFAPVTADHRRELLKSDEYCHLVINNANGAFIAYCECSIWRAEWVTGKPRIGWIDYIGTQEGQQQRGLGKAILLAALHQLKTWGAEIVNLVTVSDNLPANRLYQTTGFVETAVPEPTTYQQEINKTP